MRLEQIYPFPEKTLARELAPYRNAELVWCQEEPENMGAWNFVDRRLEKVLAGLDMQGEASGLCRPRRGGEPGDRSGAHAPGGAGGAGRRRAGRPPDMATEIKVPTLGESVTIGHRRALDEARRRGGRGGRTAGGAGDRQGHGGGERAVRRRADLDQRAARAARWRSARCSACWRRGAAAAPDAAGRQRRHRPARRAPAARCRRPA